jgi:ADP-ribose pyrophosphatase YjhB (NUDIX family)
MDTIKSWIKRRFNILIAGGTGSGKTTIGEALAKQLDKCVSIDADHIKHMLVNGFVKDDSNAGGWSELHLVRILLDEPKNWNEIKDYMIPFLTRLIAKYEISNLPFRNHHSIFAPALATVVFPGKTIKSKVEDIRLYIAFGDDRPNTNEIYPNVSFLKVQIKDLINDNVSFTNARISDMRFYVKGYKAEKKGILTKIKSFFN